jgi:pimeloyl-ACP methyl ester carboxylesterase
VGGGWDSPAAGLYPRLCELAAARGDARGLRVRFRLPTSVPECAADVVDGLEFLAARGVTRAALLGHSLGERCPVVRAVVPLSTQLAGALAPAAQLPSYTRLLAIHARNDNVLSPACSERIVAVAPLPACRKSTSSCASCRAAGTACRAAASKTRSMRRWRRSSKQRWRRRRTMRSKRAAREARVLRERTRLAASECAQARARYDGRSVRKKLHQCHGTASTRLRPVSSRLGRPMMA